VLAAGVVVVAVRGHASAVPSSPPVAAPAPPEPLTEPALTAVPVSALPRVVDAPDAAAAPPRVHAVGARPPHPARARPAAPASDAPHITTEPRY
jgi:hypothetical protein